MGGKPPNPVEALIEDNARILEYLLAQGEASFVATLETTLPKVVLIAAASWLEVRVRGTVLDYFSEVAVDHPQAAEFVRINAVERKYHTWFDWKDRNPGRFFGLFGSDLKKVAIATIRDDAEFASQVEAFHELGDLRNQLVHQNYATFTLSKTLVEVSDLFRMAMKFVDELPGMLRVRIGDDDALGE